MSTNITENNLNTLNASLGETCDLPDSISLPSRVVSDLAHLTPIELLKQALTEDSATAESVFTAMLCRETEAQAQFEMVSLAAKNKIRVAENLLNDIQHIGQVVIDLCSSFVEMGQGRSSTRALELDAVIHEYFQLRQLRKELSESNPVLMSYVVSSALEKELERRSIMALVEEAILLGDISDLVEALAYITADTCADGQFPCDLIERLYAAGYISPESKKHGCVIFNEYIPAKTSEKIELLFALKKIVELLNVRRYDDAEDYFYANNRLYIDKEFVELVQKYFSNAGSEIVLSNT